jgi:hypothetical protein
MHPVIIPWVNLRSMSTGVERNHLSYCEYLRAHRVTREQHGS